MKKNGLRKVLKRSVKKWKIGDYLRQFSIVTGGVLLTLWLSSLITAQAKQREVRQAMQLVTLELRNNVQIIHDYEWLYNDEMRVARIMQERKFTLTGLPADTVAFYWRRLTNGMGKPFRFMTDALEMFKTTGIAAEIADKQIVIDLLQTYNVIEAFDNSMELFYNQRSEILNPFMMSHRQPFGNGELEDKFVDLLAAEPMQGWLSVIPHAFNAEFFMHNSQQIEAMIDQLEKRYR